MPVFHPERLSPLERAHVRVQALRAIVRVYALGPAVAELRCDRAPGELEPKTIEVRAAHIEARHPDHHRRGVGQRAEPTFLHHQGVGLLHLGDRFFVHQEDEADRKDRHLRRREEEERAIESRRGEQVVEWRPEHAVDRAREVRRRAQEEHRAGQAQAQLVPGRNASQERERRQQQDAADVGRDDERAGVQARDDVEKERQDADRRHAAGVDGPASRRQPLKLARPLQVED